MANNHAKEKEECTGAATCGSPACRRDDGWRSDPAPAVRQGGGGDQACKHCAAWKEQIWQEPHSVVFFLVSAQAARIVVPAWLRAAAQQ